MLYNRKHCSTITIAATINSALYYGITYFITSILIPLPNQTIISPTEEKHIISGVAALCLGALPAALIAHYITTRRPNSRRLCTTTTGAILSNAILAAAAALIAASATGLLDKKNNDIGIILAIAAGFSSVAGSIYGFISVKTYNTCRRRKGLRAEVKLSTLANTIETPTHQPLINTTGAGYGTNGV